VDLNALFPYRAYVSLPRRMDRRGWLQARMADAGVSAEWFRAIDARRLRGSKGFKGLPQRAHSLSFRLLLRTAKRRDSAALFVLEDDAVFHPEFRERIAALELPDDWQIFYFGCQHLAPPKRVNDGVVRVRRALDTHAVAFRRGAYLEARKIMRGRPTARDQCTDVLLSHLHEKLPTYAAFPNLIWQALGESDIAGRSYSNYDNEGSQRHCTRMVSHLQASASPSPSTL
jgi:hypothetical protein